MKLGKYSLKFNKDIYINETGTSVGPYERRGPLGAKFDKSYKDLYISEKCFEKAERRLMNEAVHCALKKSGLLVNDIDLFVAGDLLNQITTASFTARDLNIPYFGIYNACATSVEGLLIGATHIEAGNAKRIITAVSSHNATAERQFRLPTEYAGQRKESTTFTATGGAAALLSTRESKVKIIGGTIGRVTDFGIKDPNDFGSIMAYSAYQTLKNHLDDFNKQAEDYDLILTGDLSTIGTRVFQGLLKDEGIDVSKIHKDAGNELYDVKKQKVFMGGSGAACCPLTLYANFLDGSYQRILVIATGVLFSPVSSKQQESIPSIAQCISLEVTP